MPKIKNNADNFILTQDEVQLFRNNLEEARADLYRTDFNFEEYIDNKFTEDQKEVITSFINKSEESKELEKSIDALLSKFKSMESLTIKIAFEPNVAFIKWIKEILSDVVKNSVVIIFEINRDLVAGAVFEYKGKIKNSSIEKEVLEIFEVDGNIISSKREGENAK